MLNECFSYNDELRKNGHLVAEEPLQPRNTAVTAYWKNGKVAVTDGPYAETKEQLGGIQVLEARDLNHAIRLISQCPRVKLKCGTIERERAATAKGHLAMRAATRERMFSITARGWPDGNPVNPVGRHLQQKSSTESVSEFGHWLPKTTMPYDTAYGK